MGNKLLYNNNRLYIHKNTYKRHFEILTYIENELYKQLKIITVHQLKLDIQSVIESIVDVKNNLEGYGNHLSQLRINEKELLSVLNELYGLNKQLSMKDLIKKTRLRSNPNLGK